MKRWLVGGFLLAIELAGFEASAAPTEGERRAAESFRQAQAAFGRRDYAAAAAAFEKAAEFDPHPAPLLNAAQAWELAHDYVRAAEDCDRVLALSNVAENFSRAAKEELERIRARIATLDLEGPRTVSARIDEGGEIRVPSRRRLAPGRHTLVVIDLTSSTTRNVELDLAAGDARTLDLTPPRVDTRAPATPPPPVASTKEVSRGELSSSPPSPGLRGAMWISLGVTVAATGVATAFAVMTVSAKDDYNRVPTTDTQSDFYRNRLVTNVAIATAGAAAISTVVFWRLSKSGSATQSVAVTPTIDGGRVVATVQF